MKEIEKKRIVNNNQKKIAAKSGKRDGRLQEKNEGKPLKAKVANKASGVKVGRTTSVSDSNTATEPSEVYENVVIDYVDDMYRSEEASSHPITNKMVEKESNDTVNDHSGDLESEPKEEMEEESDPETINDSVSSQGDPIAAEEEKVDRTLRFRRSPGKNDSSDSGARPEKGNSNRRANSLNAKSPKSTAKKSVKPGKDSSKGASKTISENLKNVKIHPKSSSDSSVGIDEKPSEERKEADILDQSSHGTNSVDSDDEVVNAEGNGEHDDDAVLNLKIKEMESRIEKLEEELREVAALEIALYSVVPEHGSSAHKVHTPARRLCRLYIHACKYWSPKKRATVARNTISGLVLIAKSCGSDVPRLTFWLSNTVVLREILSQTLGNSSHPSPTKSDSNGGGATISSLKLKNNLSSRQPNIRGFTNMVEDWQETGIFTAALGKVESWIFSRIVESIWWQSLTPNMQSPTADPTTGKVHGRLLGPPLGDQQQGSFSITLWKNAFQDALRRLCPVREGGHECGCLPVLARKVLEQCLTRLDVAMFNAILRESAHQIPTDPVSDPIVDSKVLPIPAGNLSFGSGAQLKNSIGNWSRWLADFFGMGADQSSKDDENSIEDDFRQGGDETNPFQLLNALSDLLMLPKDMLMDRTVRTEVCPQISLPLVKRILCNFTPDEFCPDSVPGTVLEAVNAECIVERRLSGESASSFPYLAAPAVYTPPSLADVAEKVAEAGGKSELSRSASAIQRKGYTSDEDLEELDCPLESILDKFPSSPRSSANRNSRKHEETGSKVANERFELLREVWLAT